MRVTAKVDYAVRAVAELAAAVSSPSHSGMLKGETIADRQAIPAKFLENILSDLRRAGLVSSQRGSDGGYSLVAPAASISIADIIRAVEGPLADVRGASPEQLHYSGAAEALRNVWIATRAALRSVLEEVTIADVISGQLPADVAALLTQPDAWSRR